MIDIPGEKILPPTSCSPNNTTCTCFAKVNVEGAQQETSSVCKVPVQGLKKKIFLQDK